MSNHSFDSFLIAVYLIVGASIFISLLLDKQQSTTNDATSPMESRLLDPNQGEGEEADFPLGSNHSTNVLLVIAHPDDESMFFIPTIVHLRSNGLRSRPIKLHLLCLSAGNAEGMIPSQYTSGDTISAMK